MIVIEASIASLISHMAGAIPLLGITDLGINGPSLIAYLINFVLLLGILTLFAYKPLLKVLDQRSERIRESLEHVGLRRGGVRGRSLNSPGHAHFSEHRGPGIGRAPEL